MLHKEEDDIFEEQKESTGDSDKQKGMKHNKTMV